MSYNRHFALYRPAAATGVTGTVAATDVRDGASASGTVKVTGSVASTDVRDTGAASGLVRVTGSCAASDRRDSSSASGTVKVTGSIASTDVRDACNASGSVGGVIGTAASSDRRDSSGASGLVKVVGSGAPSDRRDAGAASGTITIRGTAAPSDVRDTGAGSGTVEIVPSAGTFFEADLFAHLIADATVAALVASRRVYPDVRPQGEEDFPSAVYQVVTLDELGNLTAWSGDVEHYRLQVDCWARTDAEASALADAVRARMRTAAANFRAVMLPSAFEAFEPETRLYRVLLEFSCWYDVP